MSVSGLEGKPKIRINGNLMSSYVQKTVTLVGDLIKVESDGKRATIRTTDDQFVQVLFAQPLMSPLTPNCLMEAFGTVLSRSQLQCHDFTQFSQEMSEKFDRQTYNEFVTEFVKVCDQHFNCVVTEDHEGGVITPIDNFSMPNISANASDMSFTN